MMTVGELKKRLEDYPDDMPVCVERKTIIIKQKKSSNFDVIEPTLYADNPNPALYKSCKGDKEVVPIECIEDNEKVIQEYKGACEVSFEPCEHTIVNVKSEYDDVKLVIGELNIAVFDREATLKTLRYDEKAKEITEKTPFICDNVHRLYEECLLID